MKRWSIMALGLGVLVAGLLGTALAQERGAAELPPAKLQQAFLEGGRAYDEGRLKDAMAAYTQLVEQGYDSPALFFNLGNACFKSGKAGQAVLNYRRARYAAPRDPDTLANLRFALQSTGASAPSFPVVVKAFLKLSKAEWIALTTGTYWATAAALAWFMLARRRREWASRTAVVFGTLLIVSLAGVGSWWNLDQHPEAVVLKAGQQALFAPLDGSTPHFALPPGSIILVTEESGDWVKAESGKQSGWIRRSACELVCPWQNGRNAHNPG